MRVLRKTGRIGTAAIGILFAAAIGSAADEHAAHAKPAAAPNAAWESLKTLQGDWDGLEDGRVTRASYRLVSNGTTLMETLSSPDGHAVDMVTIYHRDGARIAMTHYCSEDTQPRMRADAKDAKRIAFRYVDATNLSSPDAARMTGLVLTLKDPDHFTQEWTHTEGKNSTTATFAFTRKK
jgi:hypothetical protein